MNQTTDSMALRWYNVGQWKKYYLACPNYGDRPKSANEDCRELAGEIQKYVQVFTRSPEAALPRAPEKGTVLKMLELVRRANVIIESRLIGMNEERKELPYNDPAYESHLIYPAPLYDLANTKMRNYATKCLKIAQAIIHHGDNVFQKGFTEKFVKDIWPEIKDLHDRICTEVVGLTPAEVSDPNFIIPEDHAKLTTFKTESYTFSNEEAWVPTGVPRLSAKGWQALTEGIPTDIIPVLPEFPASARITAAGGTGDGERAVDVGDGTSLQGASTAAATGLGTIANA